MLKSQQARIHDRKSRRERATRIREESRVAEAMIDPVTSHEIECWRAMSSLREGCTARVRTVRARESCISVRCVCLVCAKERKHEEEEEAPYTRSIW